MKKLFSLITLAAVLIVTPAADWYKDGVALGLGGGTYYGNTATPWSSAGSPSDTVITAGDGFAIFYKVDFGGSTSGTVTEIRAFMDDADSSSQEQVWTIHSHNATYDRPDAVLVSSGRWWDALTDSPPSDWAETVSGSITSQTIVWIGVHSEANSNFSGGPDYHYTAATGGTTILLELASGEWLNDSAVADSWADYAYGANPVRAITINNAGTGYTVNDVLTVSGGTGTAATITVNTVGGSGEITAATLTTGGSYNDTPPTSPASVTGGTGSSATFDLRMGYVEAVYDMALRFQME